MKKTYTSKIMALVKSKSLLQHAKMLQEGITLVRESFSNQFGNSGDLNRYPVAGGICEHWPDWAKDESRENNRQFHAALDESLKLWQAGGKKSHTWMKLKNQHLA